MSESVDVVVIGAGVVGLAVARALALKGREVLILEAHDAIGVETSSRNSEVIHAGIYYRPGGLRAQLCVPGKKLLYQYCAARHIPHARCEKLIVATEDEEIPRLERLRETARQNGVADLQPLSGARAARLEPGLSCKAALLSPSTGIVDSHALMLTLLGDIENAGGTLALSSPVVEGRLDGDAIELVVGGAERTTLRAALVVNSAGLHADKVALSIKGLDFAKVPRIRPAKGRYFTYSGKAPFSRLVYPLHAPDSQGIHYTRDLAGQGRLGPDISWEAPLGDYSVDEALRDVFFEEARKFWPALDRDRLQPGYSGQRPKATGPGEEGDFLIYGPRDHGADGYIGLYAIESPGLTSCLAIGEYVAGLAGV